MIGHREEGSATPLVSFYQDYRHSWLLQPANIAPLLAAISCVLFSCNSELLQALQKTVQPGGSHVSPMLNLILCHMGGLVFAPMYLFLEKRETEGPTRTSTGGVSSLSDWHKKYGAREEHGIMARAYQAADLRKVMLGSFLLAFLLMGYNYVWLLSSRYIAVGLTNSIFQSSVAFVYLASVALFPDTPLALPQITGVVLSLVGSALASGLGFNVYHVGVGEGSLALNHHELVVGAFLALVAALGCMLYQVAFKLLFANRKNNARFLAHVGAWVSMWHLVVMLPVAGLAHVTGFEAMTFPHGFIAIFGVAASAVIASTVNGLYLAIVMWGSSMLLPCSAAFSVPFTVALDSFFHHVRPSGFEALGQIMVVVSVVLILDVHKKFRPKDKSREPELV